MQTPPERRLSGGLISDAVRIGTTVRRTSGPATPAVHTFLRYLCANGYVEVPTPLGLDGQGREVLSYVEGRSGHPPITPAISSEAALLDAARRIREFHDLSARFLSETTWNGWSVDAADPSGQHEVVCHNDLAPFNLIYDEERVRAIIDWDGAAPGRRAWDLAYAVWRLVPLHRPAYAEPLGWPAALDRTRRLRMFADAYGMEGDDRAALLGIVRERMLLLDAVMAHLANRGRITSVPPTDPRSETGDLAYLDANQVLWHHALTSP